MMKHLKYGLVLAAGLIFMTGCATMDCDCEEDSGKLEEKAVERKGVQVLPEDVRGQLAEFAEVNRDEDLLLTDRGIAQ